MIKCRVTKEHVMKVKVRTGIVKTIFSILLIGVDWYSVTRVNYAVELEGGENPRRITGRIAPIHGIIRDYLGTVPANLQLPV